MHLLAVLALAAGALFVMVATLLIVGDYQLVVRLKRDHRAAWERLGSPSPYFTHFEHLAAVQRFLFERQYRSLGDDVLARDAERLRLMTTAGYVLAAVVLLLALLVKLVR